MAAPSSTVWGSVVNDRAKLGIYKSISSTNTVTTVKIQVWVATRWNITDEYNTLYYNHGTSTTSATTSKGNVAIKTKDTSGWADANHVLAFEDTYTFNRGTSAVTYKSYAKLSTIEVCGADLHVNTTFTVPALPSYTIKFDDNGGSGAPSNQTKYYGKTLTLSSTKPTRTGYTFQGWGTSTSDTSVDYNAGDSYTANKAITLYAIWKINTYTIKFNANGGSGAPSSQTKTYGKTLTLSSTKPTRTGYTFSKWNTAKDGSGTSYSAGGNYTTNAADTLYAIWTENKLTVNYYSNYATSYNGTTASANTVNNNNVLVGTGTFYYDNEYTNGLHNYNSGSTFGMVRTGYTATGYWATFLTGGTAIPSVHYNTSFSTGQALAEALGKSLKTGNASVDVYAQWQVNTYTVSYNANGGSGAPSNQTKTYGTALTLSSAKPTRTGYIFKGWATSATGSVKYASGASYTTNSAVTLYAVWKAKTISVVYNKNDGSGKTSTQNFTYGVSGNRFGYNTDGSEKWEHSGQFCTWDREGYTLLGWAKTATATSATYSIYSTVTNSWINTNCSGETGSINLYAVWISAATVQKIMARYQNPNGSYSSYSTAYVAALEEGDTLSWTSEATEEYQSVNVSYTVGAGAATKYIDIPRKQYTLSYNANGGVGTPYTKTFYYDSKLYITKNRPTRSGYKFLGWSLNSSDTEPTYHSNDLYDSTDTSNPTLYAIWSKRNVYVHLYNSGVSSACEYIETNKIGFGFNGEIYSSKFYETSLNDGKFEIGEMFKASELTESYFEDINLVDENENQLVDENGNILIYKEEV